MIPERFLRRGLTLADFLLVAGVALIPILAWKGIRLVEFGLIPLAFGPWIWSRVVPDRRDWLVIALFGQYAVLVALNAGLYPVLPAAPTNIWDEIGLYLGAAVTLVLIVMRLRMAGNLSRLWRWVAPLAVVVSVGLLAWDQLTLPPPDNCRVGSVSKFLLFPPLGLTVLALASYYGWDRLGPWERAVRHLALGLVIVSTVAFSGARAVLIAQAVTIPVLALLLGWGEPLRRRIGIVAVLAGVFLGGFAAGVLLDYRANCGFTERLVAIGHTLTRRDEADALARRDFAERLADEQRDTVAEGEDAGQAQAPATEPEPRLDAEDRLVAGVYIRAVLWRSALDAIRDAPLLGHGYMNERVLVVGDFPHFHEQYLSWLVWGGPLMLVSGLVMLFAPLVTFGIRRSRDGAVLALAMVGPMAINFLSSSILRHTVMVLGYVMTLALLHALSREARDR